MILKPIDGALAEGRSDEQAEGLNTRPRLIPLYVPCHWLRLGSELPFPARERYFYRYGEFATEDQFDVGFPTAGMGDGLLLKIK